MLCRPPLPGWEKARTPGQEAVKVALEASDLAELLKETGKIYRQRYKKLSSHCM
jgi:hypothetical protein